MAATMTTPVALGPPGGVVRVRVDAYEKLMASMLEEAERRIAEAVAERDVAFAEVETLRRALGESERRETSSSRAFKTWRLALVDTAADELAVETRRWRSIVAEKDRTIESRESTIQALRDECGCRTASRGTAWERTDGGGDDGRVGNSGNVSALNASGGLGIAPRGAENGDRGVTGTPGTSTPARLRSNHARTESRSGAPVAESPGALDEASRKSEAAAKMRKATLEANREGTTGDDGDVLTSAGASKASPSPGTNPGLASEVDAAEGDARKEQVSWFWPFA